MYRQGSKRKLSRQRHNRRLHPAVIAPGEQRKVAYPVWSAATNIAVKDQRKFHKTAFIAGKLANRADKEKVVWRSEWSKRPGSGDYPSRIVSPSTRRKRHSTRQSNAAHTRWLEDRTIRVYCTGCSSFFDKIHELLNHRRSFRCGGEWNEFVALGPPKVPVWKEHRTGSCYWQSGSLASPSIWKKMRNGSKFDLDKPSLIDNSDPERAKERRAFSRTSSKARIPGSIRPGRIANVSGGRYCKSPNKWRAKWGIGYSLSATVRAIHSARTGAMNVRRKRPAVYMTS